MDMTEGIIARFRTMAIARGVGAGRATSSAASSRRCWRSRSSSASPLLVGFRSDHRSGRVARGASALLVLTAFAVTWLSVALGLSTTSVETASNLPMILIILLFLSSGFVPTDSMPDGAGMVRREPALHARSSRRCADCCWGHRIGDSGLLAVGWCVALSVLGYLWATRLYERPPRNAA